MLVYLCKENQMKFSLMFILRTDSFLTHVSFKTVAVLGTAGPGPKTCASLCSMQILSLFLCAGLLLATISTGSGDVPPSTP